MQKEYLDQAIDVLYSTFARYPLRAHIWGCSCGCVTEDDQARIRSRPLRELTISDLSRYMWKALTTWGDEEDFKHFLPRICEILAYEYDIGFSETEIVVDKLRYAHWRHWPLPEQSTVENYFLELWKAFLDSFPPVLPNFFSVGKCLGTIAQCIDDFSPFLALWLQIPSASALRHLAHFAIDVCQDKDISGFWYQASWKQTIDWLSTSPVSDAIEQAFFKYADEPFAEDFAEAHSLLLLLHK